MNESGRSAGPARGALKVELDHVIAVHDELDLKFGDIRTRLGGGLAGHNGLKSLKAGFGSPDFARVRIGIGRPDTTDPEIVSAYVLGRWRQSAGRGHRAGRPRGGRRRADRRRPRRAELTSAAGAPRRRRVSLDALGLPTMRTRSVLLITLVALIAATPAGAATPVLGPADGVQATRTGATLVVTFAGDPAKWTPLVGREVSALCRPTADVRSLQFVKDSADDLANIVRGGQEKVGTDGTLHYTLHTDKPFDACYLTGFGEHGEPVILAQAAVTPDGAIWLDESSRANALRRLLDRAADPDGYRPLAALGAGIVALDGPAAAPAAGATGYWTDGARHAVVSTFSAAGRLLVIEDLGDGMLRTNVLDQGEVLSAAFGAALGAAFGSIESRAPDRDPGGRASPYRGKGVDTRDGVRGGFSGTRLTVRFTGRSAAAVHKVAGRRVLVSCVVRPPRTLFGGALRSPSPHTAVVRVPRRGSTLTVALRGIGDVCGIVDDGKGVATVLATATGRRWWADIQAVNLLDRLPDSFAAPGGQAYLAPAAIVAGRKGLMAMTGPGATPPLGRVGVWTDGARRAVVTIKSASGRRLVMVDEGEGMLRTNVFVDLLGSVVLGF